MGCALSKECHFVVVVVDARVILRLAETMLHEGEFRVTTYAPTHLHALTLVVRIMMSKQLSHDSLLKFMNDAKFFSF